MVPIFSITTDYDGSRRYLEDAEYAAIAAAGFPAVHWCQHWSGQPFFYGKTHAESLKAALASSGLVMPDLHGFFACDEDITRTNELIIATNINRIEFTSRLGGNTVVLHIPVGAYDERGNLENARMIIHNLLPAAQQYGVRLAAENLGERTNQAFFDALFDEFSPEQLGLCFDSGHANIHGHNKLLVRYIDRLLVTHLHDNDGQSDQHKMPGTGTVDWKTVLGTIKNSSYAGTVNLEVAKPKGTTLADFLGEAHSTIRNLWEAG